MITVLVRLIVLLPSSTRFEIIAKLALYFKDPDSELRKQALLLMKEIKDLQEVKSCFAGHPNASVHLFPLISSLIQNKRFKEKELLQSLLK